MGRLAPLLIILLLPLLGGCSYQAMPLDEDYETSLTIHSDYIELRPYSGDIAETGIVFYPGGLVDPLAYVEPLRIIARLGYVVIIVRAPANLSILHSTKAIGVIKNYTKKASSSNVAIPTSWVGAGHSLGGTSAAILTSKYPGFFKGLIFIASYPAESSDLSSWTGEVLSISASNDGLATPEKIAAARSLLPEDTEYYVIQGGSHAQFGNYGVQKDDGVPTISPESQWQEMSDKIAVFLGSQGWAP